MPSFASSRHCFAICKNSALSAGVTAAAACKSHSAARASQSSIFNGMWISSRSIFSFDPNRPIGEADMPLSIFWFRLQKSCRPHDRSPHMRRRTVVEAEAFLWLLEIAADDIDKVIDINLGVWIERVDIVHADQTRGHIPFVLSRAVIFLEDVGLWLVVRPTKFLVEFGITITDKKFFGPDYKPE